MNRTVVAILAGLAFVLAPTVSRGAGANGTVPSGRTGQGFANEFASAWNDSSEFICTSNSPFMVKAVSGPCDWAFVTVEFDVNSGGASNVSHAFDYEIQCDTTALKHTLSFDGGPTVGIDTTMKIFNLSGGDVVTVMTTRSVVGAPALGPWGVAVLAGFLGLGILWGVRRRLRWASTA